ncbi:hypothetical protein TDB9533_03663 [Thalassocella blandensis]|nr:hypothetical protein TDB9533_03663 [Thalassocella blandensis]
MFSLWCKEVLMLQKCEVTLGFYGESYILVRLFPVAGTVYTQAF